MTKWMAAGVFVIALAAAAACSDPTPPAAPTPVAPTISDSFSGTVTVLGSDMHQFAVQRIGGVRVTLDEVQPAAALGIGVGTPSTATGTCSVLSSTTAAPGATVQLSGTATVTGNFCVSVFDVGNLVESVTYTITVVHS